MAKKPDPSKAPAKTPRTRKKGTLIATPTFGGEAVEGKDVQVAGVESSELLATYLWTVSPLFSGYIRSCREAAGLTIRKAAPHLGVSAAYLSRLETGGYASVPSVERLFGMADLYGVERSEILIKAGLRVDVPPDARIKDTSDAEFAAILMDPQLRPKLFTDESVHYVPNRLKRQWIEWAIRLTEQADPRASLMKLIEDAQK